MKLADLMIGDWCRIKENVEPDAYFLIDGMLPGQFVKVEEILSIGINADWIGGEVNNVLPGDAIEAIPLTVEILERIGFRQFHPSTRLWAIGGKVFCDLHCPLDGRIMIGCGGTSYELRYVHQLQHALRLCGINKEITVEQLYGKEENRTDAV